MIKIFDNIPCDKTEERIKTLAHTLVFHEVDVCGFAMFNALKIAEQIIKTLNKEGYDIKPIKKETK